MQRETLDVGELVIANVTVMLRRLPVAQDVRHGRHRLQAQSTR